jgi:hypothetical protein
MGATSCHSSFDERGVSLGNGEATRTSRYPGVDTGAEVVRDPLWPPWAVTRQPSPAAGPDSNSKVWSGARDSNPGLHGPKTCRRVSGTRREVTPDVVSSSGGGELVTPRLTAKRRSSWRP